MSRKATDRSKAWLLGERVKELNCLYQISRVFERANVMAQVEQTDVMQSVVNLLPPAWQYPDIAGARITLDDMLFATPGYHEGPWQQTCPVLVRGEPVGSVSVSYAEECPEFDEGPFLAEERSLLNTVAQRLGGFIEQLQAREQLLLYQENLRSLTTQLVLSEQKERRRLAEGLHDRIGQSLALVSIELGQARSLTRDRATADKLAEIQDLIAEVIGETRSLTFALCPPVLYELGLGPGLEWLTEQFQEQYGLAVVLQQEGSVAGLTEELNTTIFQAARELLTNVAKHAAAKRVVVRLATEGADISLSVSDDGVGMQTPNESSRLTEHPGFGLFNLRERVAYLGGTLAMQSAPGRGTTITLRVPRDA